MTYHPDWAIILVVAFICTSQAFAWTREKYERALAVFLRNRTRYHVFTVNRNV